MQEEDGYPDEDEPWYGGVDHGVGIGVAVAVNCDGVIDGGQGWSRKKQKQNAAI